jgi:transposase
MIKRHLPNVLTYFRHRITNAMSEGIASQIQALKKAANSFRNRNNFKTAIYFHCGGLDPYPDFHPLNSRMRQQYRGRRRFSNPI